MGTRGPRKRIDFATKKAAEKHLSETVVKIDRGEYLELKKLLTFAQAAELWYESKTDRRASHVADLRIRLDKHILPRLGSLRLDKITVGMIEKLRNDLRAAEYAPRTINTIIRIIGAVFRAAIRRGEVARNPVDQVERAFMAAGEIAAGDNRETANDSDAVNPDRRAEPRRDSRSAPGRHTWLLPHPFADAARSSGVLFQGITKPTVRSASLQEQREFETSVSFALLLCESGLEQLRLKRLPTSTIKLDI
jgi:Phage integrase, N-terminal SAM-like domain